MRFEERELKPYAEPVPAKRLASGSAYFSVTYIDDQMLIPTVEPLIFAGENLSSGDVGRVVYFQDAGLYRKGIRHDSPPRRAKQRFLPPQKARYSTFSSTKELSTNSCGAHSGVARWQWIALGRSRRSEARPLPCYAGDPCPIPGVSWPADLRPDPRPISCRMRS